MLLHSTGQLREEDGTEKEREKERTQEKRKRKRKKDTEILRKQKKERIDSE